MKRLIGLLSLALLSVGLMNQAKADMIAYWSFNYNELPTPGTFGYLADPSVFPYAADIGDASITIGGGNLLETLVNGNGETVYRWVLSQSGNLLNVANEEIAGGSLALLIGTPVDGVNFNNGGYVQFQVNMSGYKDLVVSFATRRTSTSFNNQEWAWSTDGVNFTTFQTVTTFADPSTWEAKTLDTITALDNVATAYIRVTLTGGVSVNDNGSTRFDNVQLNATPDGGGGNATIVDAKVYHSSFTGAGSKTDSRTVVANEGTGAGTLTYDSLINSSAGVTGLIFSVQDLASSSLTASDFQFQWSPQGIFSDLPATWQAVPTAPTVTVTPGSPDSVLLTWPNGTIHNRWLRVTVKANANTGLATPEVYYVGHLVGETSGLGGGSSYAVAFADLSPIRANSGTAATSGSIYDIDKNGNVQFADIAAARAGTGNQLSNITIP